jgi:RNA polymerase sigma factor (sigma-70 family)
LARIDRRADDRDAVAQVASEILTDRQQDILRLSLAGCSVHDIAQQMGISPARVCDEKYKSIQKLRVRLNSGMC